jgi:hypothetical protein
MTVRSTTGLKGRLKTGLIFCNKPQTPRYFARYFANLAVKWTFFAIFTATFLIYLKRTGYFFKFPIKIAPFFLFETANRPYSYGEKGVFPAKTYIQSNFRR